jgi:hypothetical protein
MSRYTVHRVGERYEIHDGHTHEPSQVSFDCADAAESCARLANAIEDATVAHLEEWLAA